MKGTVAVLFTGILFCQAVDDSRAVEPFAELNVRLSEDLPVDSCQQVLQQLQVKDDKSMI